MLILICVILEKATFHLKVRTPPLIVNKKIVNISSFFPPDPELEAFVIQLLREP